jgi:hypothetical protein
MLFSNSLRWHHVKHSKSLELNDCVQLSKYSSGIPFVVGVSVKNVYRGILEGVVLLFFPLAVHVLPAVKI